ncbi:hypothetical protein F442_06943 [Phytophthora nicotianae P10297]|uniref:Uncharacterized protein n=2 Tax=Phytophthora nicotianae TaxID=4792 RepID=W2ZIT0_PHYNI|nr:hypothetical protein F444_06979 [Phytophthora nicotianae P1976]ETP46891.1 hypothetical protein F442_06943 [Phytophthora nicotianae P10297]
MASTSCSASTTDYLREGVKFLDTSDRWDLLISDFKGSWGCRKVDYFGHRKADDSLGANPNDLASLV